jgi:hypothetical protein
MKSMRRAKLKGQLRQEEAAGRAQRLAPPGNGGKRLAGKFAQQMLHAAPSNQHLHIARGVYQFQRLRPWAASAASLAGCSTSCLFACCIHAYARVRVSTVCVSMHAYMGEEADGEDPRSLYSKQEIYHSWHDQDAIVVPSSCAHVLQGQEREKTVMWGRWQLRNESSGLFRSLSVGPIFFLARLLPRSFDSEPPCEHICCACYSKKQCCPANLRQGLGFRVQGLGSLSLRT